MATLNKNTSIVDTLKSMGKDSSFEARKKLASERGMSDYTGTADQNIKLMQSFGTPDAGSDTGNSYTSMVKDELGETSAPKVDEKTRLSTERDTAKAKMDEAFGKTQGARTSTFSNEYTKRGLGERKKQISDLDAEIEQVKAERDQAVMQARSNPSLSMATLTGQRGKLESAYNDRLSNLIGQRNAIADAYNTDLGEVTRLVDTTAKDAESELAYYSSLFERAGQDLSEYDKTLLESLREERELEQWEKEMAQALTIARMREESDGGSRDSWTLIRDELTGKPKYWANPKTMEIRPIGDEVPEGESDEITFDGDTQETAGEDQPGWFQRLWNRITN